LADNVVDLAISPIVPEGYLYENLINVEFIAVAHTNHDLHQQGETPYGIDSLKHAVHIVVRDSGGKARDAGWVQNENKWTVSSFTTCVDMVGNGLGFAWLPRQLVQPLLDRGQLKPLNLRHGATFRVPVNLIYGKNKEQGPAMCLFIELLKSVVHKRSLDD